MAGTLLSIGTDQLQNQRKGAIAISLTAFDVTTVSQIAAGSIIEIGGAVLLFESDESMGANWAAMAQGIVYAYINGTTYESTYTTTAPTWSDEKQGWYDATGAHRYYARLYKDAGANYTQKAIYTNIKQVLVMDDGIGLNPLADDDVRIRVATDASILWDESEGEYVLDHDVEINANFYHGDFDYITHSGTLLKEKTVSGSIEFYLKKPIAAYITYSIANLTGGHLQIYQNGDWRDAKSGGGETYYTNSTGIEYAVQLNPGRYRLFFDGSNAGNYLRLYLTGLFSRPVIAVSEIVT